MNEHLKIIIFILLGIALIFGGCEEEEEPTPTPSPSTISGTVKDKGTDEPLVSAKVVIIGSTMEATTDDEGKYIFSTVSAGTYTLEARYEGYKSGVRIVPISKETDVLDQDFYLTDTEEIKVFQNGYYPDDKYKGSSAVHILSAKSDTNYSGRESFWVGEFSTSIIPLDEYRVGIKKIIPLEELKQYRGLVKFDLSRIPSSPPKKVLSATLFLKVADFIGSSSDLILKLHKITRSWQTESVTWNTYDGSNKWTTPGGDFLSEPLTSPHLPVGPSDVGRWLQWELPPSVVEDWINGSSSNYGFIILAKREEGGAALDEGIAFKSDSYPYSASERPKLVIRFYEP